MGDAPDLGKERRRRVPASRRSHRRASQLGRPPGEFSPDGNPCIHPLAEGRNPPSIDHYRLGSMRREKERRPARGAPAAFRSGGAAFILRVEQLGRGLRATPECRASLVRTSYSVIGLLTYLCARPRSVVGVSTRGNGRPLGSRPFRRGLGGAAGSAARQIRSEA
jgi:hypothetical protein